MVVKTWKKIAFYCSNIKSLLCIKYVDSKLANAIKFDKRYLSFISKQLFLSPPLCDKNVFGQYFKIFTPWNF
jgi:hypothetical protein